MTAESHEVSWEDRRLCSDESCIGVIGPDGRCKECGKIGGGPIPNPPVRPLAEPEPAAAADPPPGSDPGDASDAWAGRRLCSDESCIGVIGPDGRCKECGKPYAG
jgi:hypothetical protein